MGNDHAYDSSYHFIRRHKRRMGNGTSRLNSTRHWVLVTLLAILLYRVTFNFQRLAFDIQHLKTLNDCFPKAVNSSNSESSASYTDGQLTHLEYFPQGPENRKGDPSRPFVLASFTNLPDPRSNGVGQEPYSVVCRWDLHSTKPRIHSQFEQLSKKSTNSSPDLGTEVTVKRLPDTFIPKIFLSVQQLQLSTILAIAYSDGSIEVRDRLTMEIVQQDNVLEQVSGLGQIGFEFPQEHQYLNIALSPNACAAVSMADTTDMHLGLIQMPLQDGTESLPSSFHEAATEAFALHFSTACSSHGNYQDDLIAVIQLFSKQHPDGNTQRDFLSEIYRVLEVRLDHSLESHPDYLFKSPMVQRCLGMQLSLGSSGERHPRPLPAKIAQAFLDVRSVTLILTYTLKSIAGGANHESDRKKQQEIDARKSEDLQSVTGLILWCISLMGYIVDDLFQLSDSMREHGSMDVNHLNTLISNSTSPSLPLLFISSSRTFIRYLSRYLRQLTADAYAAQNLLPLAPAFACIASILKDAPLPIHTFDKLLSELDAGIKAAYQASGTGETERKSTEKAMLVSGLVPGVLAPAVEGLLGASGTVVGLRAGGEVDVAGLYFGDFSWLEVGDDRRTRMWMLGRRLDVIRKSVIEMEGDGVEEVAEGVAEVEEEEGGRRERKGQQEVEEVYPLLCCYGGCAEEGEGDLGEYGCGPVAAQLSLWGVVDDG
ncbi:hypothetical protein G7Y79_00013g034660 [Physcia stellaris]|nr:hypothetical protein G7Y79_00013g034660 [Physcia stellaris]